MSSPRYPFTSFAETQWPAFEAFRHLATMALIRASAGLTDLALRLQPSVTTGDRLAQQLEFHCEAGAPEGALYLDGRLIAHIPGVRRL